MLIRKSVQNSMCVFVKYGVFLILVKMVSGCGIAPANPPFSQTEFEQNSPGVTPTYIPVPTTDQALPLPTSSENNSYTGSSLLESEEQYSDQPLAGFTPPNLWTMIKKDDITIYPFNFVGDYAYDENGSLWMVGGFGVIKKDLDGQQTWYSMKNGLLTNLFTTIAISPTGEIWIGGANNTLFRFDGEQWINEGEKLPPPFNDDKHYLCYSQTIRGIDFSPDGSVWVMNSGIEIYRRVYDQWINVYFPKEILPVAGGGGCPIGFRVKNDRDITIERNGCCMSDPTGYHFDGQTWTETEDYAAVDELFSARHYSDINSQYPFIGPITYSRFSDWPFDVKQVLPDFSSGVDKTSITVDEKDKLWLRNHVSLFRHTIKGFENIQEVNGEWGIDNPDLKKSNVLEFASMVFFYEDGKRPYVLPWVVDINLFDKDITYSVDPQDVAWFYDVEKGLVAVDHGDVRYLGRMPVYLPEGSIGGVLAKSDGSVWVGSIGAIWEYDNGQWHQFVVPDSTDLIKFLTGDKNGILYGATDTGVFRFENSKFTYHKFVAQDQKPYVIQEDGKLGDCTFNKNYTIIADCLGIFWTIFSPDYHYKAVFLGMQGDGSIVYANNHMVAKLDDGKWKSFLFDNISIDSAAVNHDGRIWIFSNTDGLISLEPDIFGEYQDLVYP